MDAIDLSPVEVRSSFSPEARQYFDSIAARYSSWRSKMAYYVEHTSSFLKSAIPPNQKVLLVGCIAPDILIQLSPSVGVGLDISPKLIELARASNRDARISFHCAAPEEFHSNEKFDYVIVLNAVDHSCDILMLINSLKEFVHENSRIILSMLNPLWHPAIRLASFLKIRIPDYNRNLIPSRVLSTALEIKGFKVNGVFRRILVPKKIPLLSYLFNQYLSRLPLFNGLGFIQYVMAKPLQTERKKLSCSVIVPCYNEEANVDECVRRIPNMGSFTEVVVVNDGSRDQTLAIASNIALRDSRVQIVSFEKNHGKGAAVLAGIKKATGDVVMVLDADMTVPPEELPDFYDTIDSKTAEFVSGTRFLYPMEKQAMRLANYLGNILFSNLVQIIVGTHCTDTLCGTKAMLRADFTNLVLEDNSWGDFDLIFHAANLKLKSVEIPVHYKSRVAGESKMRAFKAGTRFLKLCLKKWAQST
ncbi:MAG: glycosyltransferase [Deltaproteobacteria bacterium]|nr:glycosyltransferase [Deltaproteobacteria bacterium]